MKFADPELKVVLSNIVHDLFNVTFTHILSMNVFTQDTLSVRSLLSHATETGMH